MNTQHDIQQGNILLADPCTTSSHFKKAVVLLCEHGKDGSVGFILNKPLGIPINNLLNSFPRFDGEVYYGGPVQTDTIHYLHNKVDVLDGSQIVTEGIVWGGSYEHFLELIANGEITPDDVRFYCGYTGWAQGQLDSEILQHSWLIGDVADEYVYQPQQERLWKKIMIDKGDHYAILADVPDSMCLN